MLSTLLLAFAAGFCAGNGLPYYNLGSTGRTNPTPFGESAAVNVVVGWSMFVVAGVCWHFARVPAHGVPGYASAGVGLLVVGLIHTRWENNPWRGRRGLFGRGAAKG